MTTKVYFHYLAVKSCIARPLRGLHQNAVRRCPPHDFAAKGPKYFSLFERSQDTSKGGGGWCRELAEPRKNLKSTWGSRKKGDVNHTLLEMLGLNFGLEVMGDLQSPLSIGLAMCDLFSCRVRKICCTLSSVPTSAVFKGFREGK